MTVVLFKGKVSKRASEVEIPIQNQSLLDVQSKDNFCSIFGTLAHLHPRRHNPTRISHHRISLHEIETDEINI